MSDLIPDQPTIAAHAQAQPVVLRPLECHVMPLCDRLRDATCDESNLREKAAEALEKLDALLRGMQADAARYLMPGNDCGADWFVSRILWQLDGPEQRNAQDGVLAASPQPAPQPEPTAAAEMPEFARYEVRRGVLNQCDAGRFCLFKDVQAAWKERS